MFTRKMGAFVALPLTLLIGSGSAYAAPASSASTSRVESLSGSAPQGQNHVHSILISPSNPNKLLVGMHYHLFRSTNGGRTLTPILSQMMLSLAVDARARDRVYAISQQKGPVQSADWGTHWTTVPGLRAGTVTGMYVDPATGAIYAYGLGVHRSTNGRHWTSALGTHSISAVAAGSHGSVYAASGDGLFVSTDGGSHWRANGTVGNQPVIGVAASGRVGYAVGAIGLFKTSNGGKSWNQLPKAPQGIEFMTAAPDDANELIGEVAQQGFYASYNGGASWRRADAGIHATDFNAGTVRIAPSNRNIAYTAAWGVHFYASHNGGRTWTQTAFVSR